MENPILEWFPANWSALIPQCRFFTHGDPCLQSNRLSISPCNFLSPQGISCLIAVTCKALDLERRRSVPRRDTSLNSNQIGTITVSILDMARQPQSCGCRIAVILGDLDRHEFTDHRGSGRVSHTGGRRLRRGSSALAALRAHNLRDKFTTQTGTYV